MSDRLISLLLVDDDTIYRLGLAQVIQGTEGLEVIGERNNRSVLEQPLTDSPDLIILDPSQEGWQLCQSLVGMYGATPILLLTNRPLRDQDCLAAGRAGVRGYCQKQVIVEDLMAIIRRVAGGESYWSSPLSSLVPSSQATVRQEHWLIRLAQSGIYQIRDGLNQVQGQLNQPQMSPLDWWYWRGRQRELMTAGWLVRKLLPVEVPPENEGDILEVTEAAMEYPLLEGSEELPTLSRARPLGTAVILDRTLSKLQLDLFNGTATPLEIDILKAPRRRELMYIVFVQVRTLLDELRFLKISPPELLARKSQIAEDLWARASQKFLETFYPEKTESVQNEIEQVILEETKAINKDILRKISYIFELFSYLLYERNLVIDNIEYPLEAPESLERAGIILENLIIQVSNAVVSLILNNYSDREGIKPLLYDIQFISSRQIAKFRNDISWKYRREKYWDEPEWIFESRHRLLGINGDKIEQKFVYAARQDELQRLGGWRWLVTIILETRDTAGPQFQSIFSWLGSGIVYVLTQVIGRGIGLIGRGIIQGVGSTWQDVRYGKNSARDK